MSAKKIRAVVFDFGGVIMSYGLVSRMIEEMSTQIGIPLETFTAHRKELWNRFEKCFELMRGEITALQFEETIWTEAIHEVYGVRVSQPVRWLTIEQKEEAKLNECMLSLILDLRSAGYKTALLSNCFFMNETKNSPILPIDYQLYFDVVIESCQVGTHKPNRDIFELMQSKLAVLGITDPNEVLFLDDLHEYCQAAEALGWNTIQVKTPLSASESVRELLDLKHSPKITIRSIEE